MGFMMDVEVRQENLGERDRALWPIRPMLAQTGKRTFSHPDWVFEARLDGGQMSTSPLESKD